MGDRPATWFGSPAASGLGGKQTHADRYRAASQQLRAQDYRVGAAASWVESFAAGLPALFPR
jgi:hypothetical protein